VPVSAADIVALPFDNQYALAGVQYARDSLHYTYNRMDLTTAARLRKIVAGVAFEMAFRRWLETYDVSYNLLGATHFTERDRYDLVLGGRRCDLKSFLLRNKQIIRTVSNNPGWLLDAVALVPVDQIKSTHLGPKDIYIFGFITGLEARSLADTRKAHANGAPGYLIHPLSAHKWARPRNWHNIGPLTIKSNARNVIQVEIGGLGLDRQLLREQVQLQPRVRTKLTNEYFSVLYLQSDAIPSGAIGLHSPVLKSTPVIEAHEWKNIWLYGRGVYLCGWMNKEEFRTKSKRLPPGSLTKQYRRTKTVNRALAISELRPIEQLAELIKESGRR